jgi:hypothetical protein
MPSKIHYSIHRAVSGKPSEEMMESVMRNTFNGWENRSSPTRKSLLNYVLGRGNAFTFVTLKPDVGYWRDESQVVEVGGIGLDFDDGMLWTEAKDDPILSTAWVCYPSPSFTEERQWKFRLLWRFDQPITDTSVVRMLLAKLMDLYPVDKKCSEPHRLWFGNPGAEPLYLSDEDAGLVPVDAINAAWEAWSAENPDTGHVYSLQRKIERRNRTGGAASSPFQYCPVVDGYYRDDVEVTRQLMKIIPPWGGRGSQTWPAADALMAGAAAWLGEELFLQLCNENNWIWSEGKGSMDEIVEARLKDVGESPQGFWYYQLDQLVELGAITHQQRTELMKFTWGRSRR